MKFTIKMVRTLTALYIQSRPFSHKDPAFREWQRKQ